MRIAEFILQDMEGILREWEAFASTQLPAAAQMTPLALRDHAKQILGAVAKDLATPQTRQAQAEKSRGRAQEPLGAPETAAEIHAVLRARSGFDINQLVAEYRALRASVLRRWMDVIPPADRRLEDVVRFSEAIDQAIAESISFFIARVDQARSLLLGMLGHDMRSPLNTMLATAAYLTALKAGDKVSDAAARLTRSGRAMSVLLEDLVDFNRIMLGLGINVTRAEVDLGAVLADEVDQLRGAHPGREISLEVEGDATGRWDGHRLQQLTRNLVVNAIKYGAPETPVRVALTCRDAEVGIEVANQGATVDAALLDKIFDPLERGPAAERGANAEDGLGLGLYIVREIARAHAGDVQVRSQDGVTAFTVRLPRRLQ